MTEFNLPLGNLQLNLVSPLSKRSVSERAVNVIAG